MTFKQFVEDEIARGAAPGLRTNQTIRELIEQEDNVAKSRLQRVRDAIYDVFGDVIAIHALRDWREDWRTRPADVAIVKRSIERDTFTGEDDPGGWARNASVVIHCEQDIPNGTYEAPIFELWFKVQDKLGKDLLVEHINAAVIGVYRQ